MVKLKSKKWLINIMKYCYFFDSTNFQKLGQKKKKIRWFVVGIKDKKKSSEISWPLEQGCRNNEDMGTGPILGR